MQLYECDDDGQTLAWLLDEPLDLPTPPGLEWLTPEQLDGTLLLYESVANET